MNDSTSDPLSDLFHELVDLTPEQRAERLESLDVSPEVRAELEELLAADSADTLFLAPNKPIDEIGDYELLEEIARGGMGVVYKARQKSLDRTVALKMILAGPFASTATIERFGVEAKAAANLDHPGIVPIYEVGQHEGQHFYSMKFIEGTSLEAKLKSGKPDSRQAAAIVSKVARALQHAHSKGVIHRDLKPANILLDSESQPSVADFGLAKQFDSGVDLTGSEQVLGTPSYMAPEQATGDKKAIGALSDVYSIGALLYATLTGTPPFRAASVLDTLNQVLHNEPIPPRQIDPAIDVDLETICLKCMEKNPQRRFQSAGELADDLDRYLAGEPIQARPVSSTERLRKWIVRRPTVASLIGSVALVTIVGFVAVTWQWRKTNAALMKVVTAEKAAETSAENEKAAKQTVTQQEWWAKRATYGGRMRIIQEEWNANRVANARRIHAEVQDQTDARLLGFEWDYWDLLLNRSTTAIQHPSCAFAVFVGEDRSLVTGGHSIIEWKAGTPRKQNNRITNVNARLAAVSSNRSRLLVVSHSNKVTVWDVNDWHVLATVNCAKEVNVCAIDASGSRVALGTSEGTVLLVDVAEDSTIDEMHCSTEPVQSLAFSPNSELAVGLNDGTIQFYDAADELKSSRNEHHDSVGSLQFVDDKLFSASHDRTIRSWNLSDDGNPKVVAFVPSGIACFAVHQERDELAISTFGHSISIWSLKSGQELRNYKIIYNDDAASSNGNAPSSISWNQLTGRLVSCRAGRAVTWQADQPQGGTGVRSPIPFAKTVTHWPESEEVLVARGNPYNDKNPGEIITWNPATQDTTIIDEVDSYATAAAASERYFASAYGNGHVRVWTHDGQLHWNADRSSLFVNRMLFIKPDLLIAVGGNPYNDANPGYIKAYDCSKKREIASHAFTSYAITAAGHDETDRVAVGLGTGLIHLLDINDLNPIAELDGHNGRIGSLAFLPTGDQLISGGWDGSALIWDMSTLAQIRQLPKHSDVISCIAVTPDGERIATGTGNPFFFSGGAGGLTADIRLWDTNTGHLLLRISDNDRYLSYGVRYLPFYNSVMDLSFSCDGSALAVGYFDGTVTHWDTAR